MDSMATATNQQEEDSDQDPFWDLVLHQHAKESNHDCFVSSCNDVSEDDAESNGVLIATERCPVFRLPDETRLELASLPLSEGILSPLGAQAWFGSALLTSLLFQATQHTDSNHKEVAAITSGGAGMLSEMLMIRHRGLQCLELGSGAVGLSGLALAALLSKHMPETEHEVILTDHETPVLEQLQRNVERNQHMLGYAGRSRVSVQSLDWNHPEDLVLLHSSNNSNNRTTDQDEKGSLSCQLDLVIGSELVYSKDTATACASCVLHLLKQHPEALVVIVQITDRPGWDVFLDLLLQQGDCCVEMGPVDALCHEAACQIMSMGGTLDRFDYGVCYVYNHST